MAGDIAYVPQSAIVPEKLGLKQAIFADLDQLAAPDAVGLVSAQHGVFYSMTSPADGGAPVLELAAGYGFEERRHLSKSFAIGEGLVGRVGAGCSDSGPANDAPCPVPLASQRIVQELPVLKRLASASQGARPTIVGDARICADAGTRKGHHAPPAQRANDVLQ